MEEVKVKRRSASPPINGHSSKSSDTGRSSDKPNGRGSLPRISSNLPGSRAQQARLAEAMEKSGEPKTESNSDSEEEDVKEESSPDESLTPSTPSVVQQKPKQKSPSKKSLKPPVQLIPECPRAEKAALATFEELETNWHQYKYLGKSKVQEDAMACECQFKPGDPIDRACGPHSDCINRLTQVECVDGECRCRQFCQNQRFQKRQYAHLHVVQTEMKGFGLRAGSPISRDDFIYEYIGEVVNEQTLHRRMENYGDEGIEHFYFMMLQKDEYLDATKKGGIGRFANHSCKPNCYVARWVVEGRLRMGIFAKRDIQKDEELTFNYNADRYGHEAQKCYCGEPNCIGFIGGKTQTDLGGMDELYIDALGIADEVESLGLKGSRKKKGKKLDEDFTPVLKPMVEADVPKVVNAIRQTTSRNILTKLIERIRLTDDQAVLRQVTRLRGLSLMTPTLAEYKDDIEVQMLVLETVGKWPFVNRTKIEDSKIEPILTDLSRCEDSAVCEASEKLLASWSTLEIVYRIPKKLKRDLEEEEITPNIIEVERDDIDARPTKRVKREETTLDIKPLGVVRTASAVTTRKDSTATTTTTPATPVASNQPSKGSLSQIIEKAMEDARRAQEEQAAKEAAAIVEEKRIAEEKALRKQKAKEKSEKHKRSKEKGKEKVKSSKSQSSMALEQQGNGASSSREGEKAMSNREKQLHKLIGAAVVGYLSQWRGTFESSDAFKEHAKKITQKIAELEKQGHTYKSGARLDSLSEEKRAKIKSYVKSYMGKMSKGATKSPTKDPRKTLSVQEPVATTETTTETNTQLLEQIELQAADQGASSESDAENKMVTDASESESDDEGEMQTEGMNGQAQTGSEMMEVDS